MQADMFGKAPPQGELFAAQPRAKREFIVNADTVRVKMLAMLEEVRNAETMPWPEHRMRTFETIFPQMANWLPEDEADRLRAEYAREIERLKMAVAA
jgi:hypothetical protein